MRIKQKTSQHATGLPLGMRLGLVLLAFLSSVASFAPAADAYIYWSTAESINRTSLSGSAPNKAVVNVPTEWARDLAVDSQFIYWNRPGVGSIGRARLDGTDARFGFIPSSTTTWGIAVSPEHLYWTADYYTPNTKIGRANIDGTAVTNSFIDPPEPYNTFGIAVDSEHLYWTNESGGGISRSDLDGTDIDLDFIDTPEYPISVAVNSSHIYWLQVDGASGESIGRARLDGSNADSNFITGLGLETYGSGDIAASNSHIYWANNNLWSPTGQNGIGRARIDGTNVDPSFVATPDPVLGVTVDKLSDPTIALVGWPSKTSLQVKVGCGSVTVCSLRLEARKVGAEASTNPRTVSVSGGKKKVVALAYSAPLRRAVTRGGAIKVTVLDTNTGASKSVSGRVRR